MRKLIISKLWGSAGNTAKYILPLFVILGIVIAVSDPAWNILSYSLTAAIIFIMGCSIYLSFNPADRSELSEEQKKIYDDLKKSF